MHIAHVGNHDQDVLGGCPFKAMNLDQQEMHMYMSDAMDRLQQRRWFTTSYDKEIGDMIETAPEACKLLIQEEQRNLKGEFRDTLVPLREKIFDQAKTILELSLVPQGASEISGECEDHLAKTCESIKHDFSRGLEVLSSAIETNKNEINELDTRQLASLRRRHLAWHIVAASMFFLGLLCHQYFSAKHDTTAVHHSECSVTLIQKSLFSFAPLSVGPGKYSVGGDQNGLKGLGMANDNLGVVRVKGKGCRVQLYQHFDRSGWSVTFEEGPHTFPKDVSAFEVFPATEITVASSMFRLDDIVTVPCLVIVVLLIAGRIFTKEEDNKSSRDAWKAKALSIQTSFLDHNVDMLRGVRATIDDLDYAITSYRQIHFNRASRKQDCMRQVGKKLFIMSMAIDEYIVWLALNNYFSPNFSIRTWMGQDRYDLIHDVLKVGPYSPSVAPLPDSVKEDTVWPSDFGSGQAAAMTPARAKAPEFHEQRMASDGRYYTFEQFVSWYGESAQEKWDASLWTPVAARDGGSTAIGPDDSVSQADWMKVGKSSPAGSAHVGSHPDMPSE